MAQEIEIEYKVMLTEAEYKRLEEQLPFSNRPIIQTNYYFETADFSLKTKRSALRIRQIGPDYTLTLKQPYDIGILETHDVLTKVEFEQWIAGQPIAKQNVSKQLQQLGISENDLRYYGSLTTARKTFNQNGIDYMLDKSTYHGIVDYELEIEAPTEALGLQAMQQLLDQYQVVNKHALTKIERFFNEKK